VYEDSNVTIQNSAEFNIRGFKTKVLSKKEKVKLEQGRQQILKKQNLAEVALKKKSIEAAPPSIMNVRRKMKTVDNEYGYVPEQQTDVGPVIDVGLDSDDDQD
jgi:hypothetical protein